MRASLRCVGALSLSVGLIVPGLARSQAAPADEPKTKRPRSALGLEADRWLISRFHACWRYKGPTKLGYVPEIAIRFDTEGRFLEPPKILNPPQDARQGVLAATALVAAEHCDPLRIPSRLQAYTGSPKTRIIRFDPD